MAADGRLFAELLDEHGDALAAYDAKTSYRYVRSRVCWQTRDGVAYAHTFAGPAGERVVCTRHVRGSDDMGGLTAPRARSARRAMGLLLVVLLTALAACTPPMAAESGRLVSSFTASPSFNNFREPCRIAYTLARPAVVSLRVTAIREDGPLLVADLTQRQKEPRGRRTADWRGVGADGRFVPQGTYHVELTATAATGGPPTSYTLATYLYRD